jgi:dephospho-CoA kinase
MLKIAVTGGAASGKSLVCECFKKFGAHTINLDALAREAVQPGSAGLKAIVGHFGTSVLAPDGTLDRKKLRGIITKDSEAKEKVEQFTHPEILRLFEKELAAIQRRNDNAVVVAEVPLLVEAGIQDRFDVVVLVEATSELQEKRLIARDGASVQEAEALLAIQMPLEEKRPHADHVVKNVASLEEVERAVGGVYRKITKGF